MTLRTARRQAAGLLKKIEACSKHGGGRICGSMLRRFIDIYLKSLGSKAVALAKAEPTLAVDQDLFARAARLDVYSPYVGTVPWRYKPRKSGPPRCVCNFPVDLKARHVLIANLVCAQIDPGPHVFDWAGRGRDRLARSLACRLQVNGQHVLLADVRQCFASVNIDAIGALNLLPPELIRNALDHRALRFRRYGLPDGVPMGMEEWEQTAPRGLLEGSAASNPLLVALFNDLPDHLDTRVAPLMFGDNIAIVAPSEEACSQAEKDLVRYFADHFAGPFSLTCEHYGPRESFEFLGYSFEIEPAGTLTVTHSTSNYAKAMRRLYRDLDVLSFASAEQLVDEELLRGFPAVSESWREDLIILASEEIHDAKRGLAG